MALKDLQFQKDVEINRVIPSLKAAGKTGLYSAIAEDISRICMTSMDFVLDNITIQEERTPLAIGNGVALLPLQFNNRHKAFTTLMHLQQGIDLKAFDSVSVDIVCVAFSPLSDGPLHLRRLSRLTRLLKNSDLLQKIRETQDEGTIRSLIHNPDGWMLAA